MGLGARLAMVFAAVAVATALLVGGASYVATDRQLSAEIDEFLKQRVNEIVDGQRNLPRDRRDREPRGQVIVAVSPDAEVQTIDANGTITSNTDLLLPVDDIDLRLAAGNGKAVLRTVSIDGADYRVITDHLESGGAIQVARSLNESASLRSVVLARTLIAAAAVATLAAGAGWVVAQRTTRPLRALTDAVDEVAETRSFTVPVPTSGRDEVGRLAHGFNRMLEALRLSQEQQRRLVQDAAHELRTPLTSMTANVDWLIRAPDIDPVERGETLSGVRRELSELNAVIAEIIELATDAHEPPTLVPTDLVAVVDRVVQRSERRSGRSIAVTSEPVSVMGDADSLARAVANLLSNAIKYSPAEAPIAIAVGPGGVFVDDGGPGIPAGEQQLVFERFYRRDEDRSMPGSGLGLSIVAGIVEQHGGQVSASASDLGGARVGFTLPAL